MHGQVEAAGSDVGAQKARQKTHNDSIGHVLDSIWPDFSLCSAAWCDSKAYRLIIQGLRHDLHQIFLSRISALIHFRVLGSIWRLRYERHCFRIA
jgi:hypothetical protein